jgi:DNA-directed RNA polymerase subunit RPC12/RpoP
MVETLGQALDAGWAITCRCAWGKREGLKSVPACTWTHHLDMTTLVATRGRDFPLARLAERLRCPRCGSRRIAVMFEPASKPPDLKSRASGYRF